MSPEDYLKAKNKIAELDTQMEPLETQRRALKSKILNHEEQESQQYYTDNLKGKIFYCDKTTFRNYAHIISLNKVIEYDNSMTCRTIELTIFFDKTDKYVRGVRLQVSSINIRMLSNEHTLITPEKLQEIKDITSSLMANTIEDFMNITKATAAEY
jgi:hypothetical protein